MLATTIIAWSLKCYTESLRHILSLLELSKNQCQEQQWRQSGTQDVTYHWYIVLCSSDYFHSTIVYDGWMLWVNYMRDNQYWCAVPYNNCDYQYKGEKQKYQRWFHFLSRQRIMNCFLRHCLHSFRKQASTL